MLKLVALGVLEHFGSKKDEVFISPEWLSAGQSEARVKATVGLFLAAGFSKARAKKTTSGD